MKSWNPEGDSFTVLKYKATLINWCGLKSDDLWTPPWNTRNEDDDDDDDNDENFEPERQPARSTRSARPGVRHLGLAPPPRERRKICRFTEYGRPRSPHSDKERRFAELADKSVGEGLTEDEQDEWWELRDVGYEDFEEKRAQMREVDWEVDSCGESDEIFPDWIAEKYGLWKPDWAWGDGTSTRGRGTGRGARGSRDRGGRGGRGRGARGGRGGHGRISSYQNDCVGGAVEEVSLRMEGAQEGT
ncbi:hypothetical protein V1506DRAFT_523956 [Lipomyces tetrasporus]